MREKYLVARTTGADFESCVGLLSDIGCLPGSGGMAGHLRRIISSPSIGAGGAPFSPTAGELGYKDDTFHTTSLPTSRTGTPEPLEEDQADSNIEVMTKSCAQRNNLYDLHSLLHIPPAATSTPENAVACRAAPSYPTASPRHTHNDYSDNSNAATDTKGNGDKNRDSKVRKLET